MNRSDFQQLAELHLQHARALLDAGLYSGAYYMCGYVVECALKACICRRTNQFDFSTHPKTASKAWSHEFAKLLEVSELEAEFDAACKADGELDVNWKSVKTNWSPDSRYEARSQEDADDLFDAIADPDHGVLSCIKRHW
jgi:HEPN domain-containing protein